MCVLSAETRPARKRAWRIRRSGSMVQDEATCSAARRLCCDRLDRRRGGSSAWGTAMHVSSTAVRFDNNSMCDYGDSRLNPQLSPRRTGSRGALRQLAAGRHPEPSTSFRALFSEPSDCHARSQPVERRASFRTPYERAASGGRRPLRGRRCPGLQRLKLVRKPKLAQFFAGLRGQPRMPVNKPGWRAMWRRFGDAR